MPLRFRVLCLAGLLAACGSSTPSPASDASVADLGIVTDVPSADTGSDAMTCDPGAVPANLPMIHGTMAVVGGDAGVAIPTPAGGEVGGTWVIETVDMYWPAAARGQIIPEGGSISGTGWETFENGTYRLSLDLVLRIDTMAAGIIARPSSFVSRGMFTVMGTDLVFTPECTVASTGMTLPRLGFSRDAPDRGRLFLRLSGSMGNATLVFGIRRAS